jgi:hypothetical protein
MAGMPTALCLMEYGMEEIYEVEKTDA